MSEKYTPGEWLIRHTNPKAPEIVYIQTGEGYLGGRSVAVLFPSEHSEADARLIIAAKDLLALAQQYAGECARCSGSGLITIHIPGNEGVPESDADDQPCTECEDIRKVIAKALGKS